MTDEPEVIEAEHTEPETALAVREEPEPQLVKYTAMTAAREWAALMAFAEGLSKSALVPATLQTVEDVTVVLMMGNADGVDPMTALQEYHVINGKAGRSANLIRRLVYERIRGSRIDTLESTDKRCVLVGHRPGHSPMEVEYTIEEAQRAKLTGKDNWRNHPDDMLFARATTRLCRRYFPDATSGGAYTPDELEESTPAPREAPESDPFKPAAPTRAERAELPPPAEPEPQAAPPAVNPVLESPKFVALKDLFKAKFGPKAPRKQFLQWVTDQTGATFDPKQPAQWTEDAVDTCLKSLEVQT